MKKLFVFAVLAALVACKEKGDTTTPKGIIISAVQALSDGRSEDFKNLLSEGALQKYGTAQQQDQLKGQLGKVRQLEMSDEKVLSHSKLGNSTMTVSQVDVSRSGQILYNVITRCTETTTSSTRTVCHTYTPPDDHDRDGYDYDRGNHNGGGGYNGGNSGGYSGGDSNGGGGSNHDYVRPGPSHDAGSDDGGSSGGGKPGNQDPDRPGRFPLIEATSANFSISSDCQDVVDYNTSVSCKIIDVK